MTSFKQIAYKAVKIVTKPLQGSGIGRIKPINFLYQRYINALTTGKNELIPVNNYKMYFHSENMDCIDESLMFTHQWEPCMTLAFKKLIKPGMVMVDIGANVGYFSLLCSTLVGKSGRVFSFEPEPGNFALLMKNIQINSFTNVEAVPKAVSDKNSTLRLYINTLEQGMHSIIQHESGSSTIDIEAVSLDEFFATTNHIVDIIKIDIEGAEVLALKGMQNTIQRNEKLLFFTEFWPEGLLRAGTTPLDYYNSLKDIGFKYTYLIDESHKTLRLANYDEVLKSCYTKLYKAPCHVNLLCSKNELAISMKL